VTSHPAYVLGLGYLSFFGVISANMGHKFLVPLQLEVAQHFVEGSTGGRSRRFEPPAAFGTAKTPKTLPINPNHFPAHGRRRSGPMSTRLLSRNETFRSAINGSFRGGTSQLQLKRRHPV
jgi:hypothetical protein